jgi:hypothetical protein
MTMKFRLFPAVALAVVTTLFAVAASQAAPETAPEAQKVRLERGRYLVTTFGCNDCHTPFKLGPNGPEPDMTLMLSGHPQEAQLPPPPKPAEGSPWIVAGAATLTAWAGPWGVSYTANLTPDKETGLGDWTEDEFKAAMHSGRHRGRGRRILPPMPWQALSAATDEDLAAIFAYLQTIPAIKNQVPEAVLAPPPPMPAH